MARRVGHGGLVSVVIPCHNHQEYVGKAIKSVLDQSYKNIQLIVIDDGSTDDSVEVLGKLAKQRDFDLICQDNRGVCRALNRAIRDKARGEYIALLASDDIWHSEKVAIQLAALEKHGQSEFCFSQALEFHNDQHPDEGRLFPKRVYSGDVLNKVMIRQHVPAGTMIFSRRLYDELGGFDEGLKEEDWDFVIRCAARTPFVAIPEPLLFYRSHQGNTMKTRDRRAIFHQKALILSKNFNLVSPWRWILALSVHFIHDIVVKPLLPGK